MKNLIEYILIHLVQHPDEVSVEESQDDKGLLYTISVHPEDMGRVIGKNGSIISAIRTIAKVRAAKEGSRVHVTIAE